MRKIKLNSNYLNKTWLHMIHSTTYVYSKKKVEVPNIKKKKKAENTFNVYVTIACKIEKFYVKFILRSKARNILN